MTPRKRTARKYNPNLGTYQLGKPSPNKGKRFEPNSLTREQVLALIRACSQTSATGARNAALIAAVWGAGLRIDEALSLMPGDVDPQNEQITVRRGKGAKFRIAGLIPGVLPIILRWIERRRQLPEIAPRSPLFCTIGKYGGKKLHASALARTLVRLKEEVGPEIIGPEVRVNPHSLRHSHATDLLLSGVNVGAIQRQIGHRSMVTTVRYLDHVSNRQAVEAVHTVPPLVLDTPKPPAPEDRRQ